MAKPYYTTFHEINNFGISVFYSTAPGGYHPLHWHDEIELLYQLNGDAVIQIEENKYKVPKKHLTVLESRQVHSAYIYSETAMFICIHISRTHMKKYLPDIDLYKIHCIPAAITDEQFPEYLRICKKLEDLTRLYIMEEPAFLIESEGIIMQVLAHLFRYFSTKEATNAAPSDKLSLDRIRTVISYVEKHYMEPISLQDISDHLGLGKEYFCRFFKRNMGMSFLRYLNEVRASHVYQDLILTDDPIAKLAEENGFTNQKLFNRTFKEIYGCTPSSVRKGGQENNVFPG